MHQNTSSHHAQTDILSLPLEALEDILVFLAFDNAIQSISSVARTCRKIRQFIYDPLDTCLWRRIFLTTFDDPRQSNHESDDNYMPFDWGAETRRRICAAIRLRPRNATADPRVTPYRLRSENASPESTSELTSHLRILTSVLTAAKPLSPTVTDFARIMDPDALAKLSLKQAEEQSLTTPASPRYEPHDPEESKNLVWVRSVLERGLPCELGCRFGHRQLDKIWTYSAESQALHHLLALVGIGPIISSPAPGHGTRFAPGWRAKDCFQWLALDERARKDLARHVSQTRVYNMSYPSHPRAWGPYLPVAPAAQRKTSSSASAHAEDDPPLDLERDGAVPPPEKLYPDWVQLAAIRIAVEGGLPMSLVTENKELLQSISIPDGLRAGAWAPLRPQKNLDHAIVELLPDGVQKSYREWDWAGVEGVWKRYVCWLGYTRLLHYNERKFKDNILFEETLMVPLTVHIVGYTPCTVPGYEQYPNLQVEGQMGGGDWKWHEDTRRIYGTVGVIADGSIRWSLYSTVAGDPNENEWISEGVQMGGLGSTTGIFGTWTGAQHDRHDPVGDWWQWRVA